MNQENANYKMIDIDHKVDTHRKAVASGYFYASHETIKKIINKEIPKGDVLSLAEIAGIQGAKLTSQVLPLCHPLQLTSVRVWTECLADTIQVFCEAKTISKTGVEMEALCGVNAALLCIYDLVKSVDPVLEIKNIKLHSKEGGKTGHWMNPTIEQKSIEQPSEKSASSEFTNLHFSVITMSDRAYQEKYEDHSGAEIVSWVQKNNGKLIQKIILPDEKDKLMSEIKKLIAEKSTNCILISGGTGLSKRDITPEAVSQLVKECGGKEICGIGELLRNEGIAKTKFAVLSRSSGYLIENTLIITLPGSVKAVLESLPVIHDLIPHMIHTARGGSH